MEDLRAGDPAKVGPFRLAARLGAGGMGVVFIGADSTGRRAAVKVIQPDLARNADFRRRFAREAQILGRINGACTARVLAADVDSDPPYLALEAVPGPNLADHVGEAGPLAPELLRPLAVGILEALTAIHAAGVIHRDLKPANVLLAPDGPKVIDFGIAHLVDATSLTRSGSVMGSPAWMAPEQFDDQSTTATDVFAWASTVVFAACGQPPFGVGRVEAVYMRMMRGEPTLPPLPPELATLITRALASDPTERPSVPELLAALLGDAAPADPAGATVQMLRRDWTLEVTQPSWPAIASLDTWPPSAGVATSGATEWMPPSRAEDGGSGRSRRPRVLVAAVAMIAAAASAVLLSGALANDEPEQQAQTPSASQTPEKDSAEPPLEQLGVQADERRRVTAIAEAMFSYQHDQMGPWRAAFAEHASGAFLEELQDRAAEVTSVATQYKAVVRAEVVAVGVLNRKEDSTTFLVFMNQMTTSTRADGQQTDQSRVLLQLDNATGKATQMTPDGAYDAAPATGRLGMLAQEAVAAVEPLLSISAKTYDSDVDQVLARATGPYEEDFRARTDDLRAALTENNVTSESEELAAAVVSASSDTFTALLQGDTLVKNSAAPEGRVNTYRIKADLVRDGDVWKVRSLEFVE